MADNITVTQGTGTTMATDDVSGVQYPRVKPSFGVDGSAVDVSASNPLPVVQTGTPALPTGAATEATLAALDAKVVAVDTGAVVVSSSALPTGAATEATLAALDAKVVAVDTGAVVVSSSALPTGAATEATLAALDAKVVAVDTGAIAGTVTANAGTDLNTSLLALESGGNLAAIAASVAVIDDWDESDRAKVNPIAGEAGVQGGSGTASANTQRVVLATDVALPAGSNFLGSFGGNLGAEIAATFTRPSDTTAYAAKDAVSNSTSSPTILTFTSMARISGGSGYITKARLYTNQSTNVSLFRLHLYNSSITAINDNAAFTILDTNAATHVGAIDFPVLQTEGSGSDVAYGVNSSIYIPFVTSGSANLFGLLEVLTAFTPASAQTFKIYLSATQN